MRCLFVCLAVRIPYLQLTAAPPPPLLAPPQTKPVIASMSDVAASGGFYMAMAAQKVGDCSHDSACQFWEW